MNIIKTVQEWRDFRATGTSPRTGTQDTTGFVPTMGALHEGHLSLVDRCRTENKLAVVSIFVNPTQFNNPDDLAKYPSSFEEDCRMLEAAGTDILFAPAAGELYPDDYDIRVSEQTLSRTLCGASRPGHFEGVLTVVLKLLNIISPDRAYFGEKDYQQFLLIEKMTRALFLTTEIIPCPLVRESSGLAMSSRNRRLSPVGRAKASEFFAHLSSGAPVSEIKSALELSGFEVDYIEETHGRIFGAVILESVRLIDNVKR
jgi:pantoate--beta-alanine ligase